MCVFVAGVIKKRGTVLERGEKVVQAGRESFLSLGNDECGNRHDTKVTEALQQSTSL